MLFDTPHILYMVISTVCIAFILIANRFLFKQQKHRDICLKVSAVITVVLHYSSLYVDYFTTGTAEVSNNMLLPIYPCHIMMWTLLICAFYKNKNSKIFKTMAEFTFYIGIVGGIVGIAFNEIYSSTPDLSDWDVLKGLLSHCTLLIGCISLLTNGYIKIRVKNVISVAIGLILLVVDGFIIITLFNIFNLDPPNSMYLLENPFPALPWINTPVIGIVGLLIVFTITSIFELVALQKEERWYNKFKKKETEV